MNKWVYELFYRLPFVPISWIFGSPHEIKEYTQLVENGGIPVGRAIDLGCGEGSNAIYLAQNGFDVTGVDFSPNAIRRAAINSQTAGVEVNFIVEDLTNIHHVSGTFDLLVDFGALNDMNQADRNLYMQNVLPLTHPGSCYILLCITNSLPAYEVEQRFTENFVIETLTMRSESATGRSFIVFSMSKR